MEKKKSGNRPPIIAVNPNVTWEFVWDETDKNSPVFILAPLTAEVSAQIQNAMGQPGTQQLLVLENGLKGWRNLKDAEDNEIPYPKDSESAPDFLPVTARTILVMQIGAGQPIVSRSKSGRK